jgi:hypothetical protein
MEIWGGVAVALIGALAGWFANVFAARRQATTNVKKAAFRCYVRLMKIAGDISGDTHPNGREGEFRYLGHDLDVYRDAIGEKPRGWRIHERMWLEMIPILMEHQVGNIDDVAGRLRAIWDPKCKK